MRVDYKENRLLSCFYKKRTDGLSTVQVFLRKNDDDLYLLVLTKKLFNAKDAFIITAGGGERPAKQFL